jgi:hypothetical protein
MGWSDKQAQAAELIKQALEPSVPAGEALAGCVYATQSGTFSNKLFAIGVTDQHLLIQQVDRKWKPSAPVVVATADEIEVGNIFSNGAKWTLTDKDREIRFKAKGEKYKLNVLGGNMIEDKLAGGAQADGLQTLARFLQTAPR